MERLEVELAQARRHGRRLAIVSLNIDRFKFINDTSDTPWRTICCSRWPCA